jgi:hypothetical protein
MINRKNIFKKSFAILFLAITIFSLTPKLSFAQTSGSSTLNYSGWVQCDGVIAKDGNGNLLEPERNKECNFINLINMVKYLINWLFGISVPIMVAMLAYSGYLHMTGKEANIKKSYEILKKAVLGFVVMLMAWFIVTTILKWVVKPWAAEVAGTIVEQQK